MSQQQLVWCTYSVHAAQNCLHNLFVEDVVELFALGCCQAKGAELLFITHVMRWAFLLGLFGEYRELL